MSVLFLSIGSNVAPKKNILSCLEKLHKKFNVLKISSVYETDPVGMAEPAKFWNLALAMETDLSSETLRKDLRALEESLGRKRDPKNKYAPRTIDIDLLPEPGYQDRAFIMIPLAEIAPDEKDPKSGKTFSEIAQGVMNGFTGKKVQL